jgi:transcriptional regulator with XRE-family HTH domain
LRHAVEFLRSRANLTQAEFGRQVRVRESAIVRFEAGLDAPSEDELRRMAIVADVDWTATVTYIGLVSMVRDGVAQHAAVKTEADVDAMTRSLLTTCRSTIATYLDDENVDHQEASPAEAEREAQEIWTALELFPVAERRWLIEHAPPRAMTHALVARVRTASERAAEHAPDVAMALAELAWLIMVRVLKKERAAASPA